MIVAKTTNCRGEVRQWALAEPLQCNPFQPGDTGLPSCHVVGLLGTTVTVHIHGTLEIYYYAD